MLAEKPNLQEAAEKSRTNWQNAETKKKKAEQIKEKLDLPASNGRRRCRSGTPGDARDAPTEHFQQKDLSKSITVTAMTVAVNVTMTETGTPSTITSTAITVTVT